MKAELVVPKDKFRSDIQLQIAEGHAILKTYSPTDACEIFEKTERAFRQWNNYNHAWLEHSFVGMINSYLAEYNSAGAWNTDKAEAIRKGWNPSSLGFRLAFFKENATPKIEYLEDLLAQIEFLPLHVPLPKPPPLSTNEPNLSNLHSIVQQATYSLFKNGHYRQAVLDSCIALDKAVQDKAVLPATITGKPLMTTAFSANQPLIRLSQDPNEQLGFMNLYQGSVQAIRNHYAHNLTEIPAPRALEWLGFISALFYKLDDAIFTAV